MSTPSRVLGRLLTAALVPVFLSACAGPLGVARGTDPAFVPVAPADPIPPQLNSGAIFQVSQRGGLFDDDKARRVGDILTVLLVERTQARKSAATTASKESNVELQNPSLLGVPVTRNGIPIFNATVDGSRSFDGQGDSAQSNELDGSIAVTVAEVLSNGNLRIQGEKWIRINHGEEYIRLQGIVRPVDIGPDNSILSTQIANVQVAYGGTGALADSNQPGWLTRIFSSPIFPF
jgi:flagellar L-ring protein precursor FlgH